MSQNYDLVSFFVLYFIFGPLGFLGYLVLKTTIGWYMCHRYRAIITPTGIKWLRDKVEVNISDIDIIKADFEESVFSSNVLSLHLSDTNKSVKACLDDREMVKLAHTRLNKWVINGSSLSIEQGGTAGLSVCYSATSRKYDLGARLYSPVMMLTIIFIVFFGIFMFFEKLQLLFVLIAVFIAFFGLERYKRVSAILNGHKLSFGDENGQQHCMALEDVKEIEKDLFAIKVTGSDGREFFFPRAFYYLPELICCYAGSSSNRR
ncbi:hypothetical protein [Anaeroselena agilis]|uniref:Uncharacterized protein n=1 Tax=Anaeroselena agilis TaxID=3063788 RepID=A0ABU3NVK4_9FIRM|nr:hypothetical protein [Selenomonadales bacterium 4137-cl]